MMRVRKINMVLKLFTHVIHDTAFPLKRGVCGVFGFYNPKKKTRNASYFLRFQIIKSELMKNSFFYPTTKESSVRILKSENYMDIFVK